MPRYTPPIVRAFSLGSPGAAGWCFYSLVIIVATWLALLPVNDKVAEATMRRMHLCSGSFAAWAPQQISPAMYNFANRGFLTTSNEPLATMNKFETIEGNYFNHFPVRSMIWIDRTQFWPLGVTGYYQTRFQGRELKTKYRLEPWQGEGWHVVLESSEYKNATE